MRLTYNLAEISDGPSFEHGRGKAKLLKVVKALSKEAKKPMLVWYWKFLSGPNKGVEIRTWTSLQENALSGVKEHLIALGERGRGKKQAVDANTDKLIGKVAILEVGATPSSTAGKADFVGVVALFPLKAREDDDDEPENDEDEKPRKKRRQVEEEDDDEDDDDDDDGDDDSDDDDDDDDDDEDEDEDDDDRPSRKKSSSSRKPARRR